MADEQRTVIQFNEFRKEQRRKHKPIVIPIDDAEYEFPADMPAGVTLILMAYMREHGEDADLSGLPLDTCIEIFEALMNPKRLKAMTQEHDLGTDELFWILGQLLAIWMADMPEMQPGNAPERLEKLSTSSKAGRSSKRTSRATTASAS